jgi:hypothetical protein
LLKNSNPLFKQYKYTKGFVETKLQILFCHLIAWFRSTTLLSEQYAFDIHVTDALAPNLNGYFWAIGDWNKK